MIADVARRFGRPPCESYFLGSPSGPSNKVQVSAVVAPIDATSQELISLPGAEHAAFDISALGRGIGGGMGKEFVHTFYRSEQSPRRFYTDLA